MQATNIFKRNIFTIIPAYQTGVRFTFGKFTGKVDAGLRLNLPIIHQIHRIDTRDRIDNLQTQKLIASNGVSLALDAAVGYKIVDVQKAVLNVNNVVHNVHEKCQLELREAISSQPHDYVLRHRDAISKEVVNKLEKAFAENWGVELKDVKIKDIALDEKLQRSLAVSAEAAKNAEAKIINAEADIKTAELYKKAAEIYAENPITLRLREFQLWGNIAKDPNSKFFVIPSNIVDFLKSEKK